MSIGSEYAREQEVEDFCKKIVEKIKKYKRYPKVKAAFKELGAEVINEYTADPIIKLCIERKVAYTWIEKYQEFFK